MATVMRGRWAATFASDLPRRDRQPCDYEAYVPDTLADREISLYGTVAADVADAEASIIKLSARFHKFRDAFIYCSTFDGMANPADWPPPT